jgi:hypothetical protein
MYFEGRLIPERVRVQRYLENCISTLPNEVLVQKAIILIRTFLSTLYSPFALFGFGLSGLGRNQVELS